MEDIIKDELFGEVKYKPNIGSWVGITDAPLYNSEGNLKLVVQDHEKEGILDVQREAYKTYLQNADKYKESAVDYLLDYYKWNYEYIASEVSGVNEKDHKDVVTETQLFEFMTLWYLFICRDGSFGYAFGCCWDVDNGLAVLLSEEEPRVISRTQLKNLHKINDDDLGLLVHYGKNTWKGWKKHSLFGKNEHLEIEFDGKAEEGITEAQKKAYAEYMERENDHFGALSKMMLTVYTGSETKAEEILSQGIPVNVATILPKTLYIDRNGNYGWICYTDWDKGYVGVLLSGKRPYIMDQYELKALTSRKYVEDEEMGIFFDDYIGLCSLIIVRMGSRIYTLPFAIEFFTPEKVINEEMRKTYRNYVKYNATLWKEVLEWSLDFYEQNYEDLIERFDVPEELQIENIKEESVMSLMDIRKLYMTNSGRIAWLCEYPTVEDGLAYEFNEEGLWMIPQWQII